MTKLTRLLNADGEVVGYFSHFAAAMTARKEWDDRCVSIETATVSLPLQDIDAGDGDRVDYVQITGWQSDPFRVYERIRDWHQRGAASVEVSRFLVNKYRRPGLSSRDTDLGGPERAAGVLYILKIKAPK